MRVLVVRSRAALTASAYLSMFFLGVGNAVIGAASGNIGLAPYQIGLFIAAQNLGFFITVITAGALSDSVEKPRLLCAGSLLAAVSFFLFYLWRPFLLNLLIMFFIGAAMGVQEGVTDAMLLDIHQKRQALHIGINHFFVTLGGLLITGYLVFLQGSWRESLVQSSAGVLVLALLLVFAGTDGVRRGAGSFGRRIAFLGTRRVLGAVFAAAVIFVGIESGLTGLLTTFLLRLRGYDLVSSKLGLILFLSGIALGRALFGLLARRERIRGMLLALVTACGIFSAVLFLVPLPAPVISLALFLLGITVSSLFPLSITITGFLFPDISGTAIGVVKLAVPVGGIFIPLVIAGISRMLSLELSLLIFPLLSLLGLAVIAASGPLIRAGLATAAAASAGGTQS
ncbi:MAG TPA: MFS transporter [Spirochaetia bacterium]|nr:MFS transporter [Spirochaetia bacterium]